jgi:hypothetical protein
MNRCSIGSFFFGLVRLSTSWFLLGVLIVQAGDSFRAGQRWAGFWVGAAFCLGAVHAIAEYAIRERRSQRSIEEAASQGGSRS